MTNVGDGKATTSTTVAAAGTTASGAHAWRGFRATSCSPATQPLLDLSKATAQNTGFNTIDRDGSGGNLDFEVIVTLDGVTTNLETLLANHQPVVA